MRDPCEPLIPLNGCKITHFPPNYQIFQQKSFVTARNIVILPVFQKKFKDITGVTPAQYISRIPQDS